jgi:hypothetical protein
LGASAEDPTVAQTLRLLEGALQSIKSFDVRLNVKTTIFIEEEYAEQPGDANNSLKAPVLMKSTMLPPGQGKVQKKSYRQVFAQGKGRIEYLDESNGKPTAFQVYDREVARIWHIRNATATIEKPIYPASGDLGDDYLDAFRDLYHRLPILDGLRQRKDVVVKAGAPGDPSIVLETAPDQKGAIVYPKMGFRVTLDPGHGFMPARIERFETIKGKLFRRDDRFIAEWKDLGGGLWVPIKIVVHAYDPDDKGTFGERYGESVATVDVGRSTWNTAIPEETFQLAIPAGVSVIDYVRHVEYVTGKPDLGTNLEDLAASARDAVPVVVAIPPEPSRWWASWPIYVLGGLLAAGGVAVAGLRLRNRKVERPT